MKTKWIIGGSLTVLFGSGLFAADLTPKKPTPMEIFMRQKLIYSQKIVEGIALENYSMIITNSFQLHRMTQSNDWAISENVRYLEKLDRFRSNVTVMTDAAFATNTEAVLKAYTKVTADCVDCHQSFRREQREMDRPGNEKK